MIDPKNPPHIDTATDAELQEFLFFSIAVAGKNAARTASSLHSWLSEQNDLMWEDDNIFVWQKDCSPFSVVYNYLRKYTIWTESNFPMKHLVKDMLAGDLRRHGFGCYNQRAESFIQATEMYGSIGIRRAKFEGLLQIKGVGLKTASFFLAYTGMEPGRVILDTHILAWLREQGRQSIPKATPRSRSRYDDVSAFFCMEAALRDMTTLELDRKIWQERAT